MGGLHIECLKYFYDVASMGSISKVANHCHISQPALSQQIQKLEDILGYKLLKRSNRGVELTDAGQIVQRYSKSMIKSYDNMLEDLSIMNISNNIVRIDSLPTVATYSLPCTIYKIKEEYPNYKVHLNTNLSDNVEQNVLNDVSDIGFIHGKPHGSELTSFQVGIDRIVAVTKKNTGIKEEMNIDELQKVPLIMLADSFKIKQKLKGYFKNIGKDLSEFNILFDLDSIESVKSTVIKGYGLTFLPYVSVKKELYTKQLQEVKIKDFEMNYEIHLIYKENKKVNKCVGDCIKYYKKIGKKSFC